MFRLRAAPPLLALALALALPLAPHARAAEGAPAAADAVLGDWNGALRVGGQTIRLVAHFTRRADGSLAGTLDSPDQGASGLVMDSVGVAGDSLTFLMRHLNGHWRGALADGGRALNGVWTQGLSMPLDFARGGAPALRARAQDPVRPYPYDEEEVVIQDRAAGLQLAGTLTRPRGRGPFPAALLITGSGPQDRDEALLGHRPFLVLADRLTRAGLVVLRCDDRGTAKSTGTYEGSTTADFAADARDELAFLRARPEVDPARVGLIGHSEGGLIAPRIAGDGAAFVVLLAGPGVPGDSLLALQGEAVLRVMGEDESVVAWNHLLQRRMFDEIRAAADTAGLLSRLQKVVAYSLDELPAPARTRVNRANLDVQARMMASPWFRWFVTYDPAPALRRLTCPVLALGGSRDVQVPPQENLAAIAAALAAGGNRDYRTVELPGLNHLFQTSATGSPADYGTIEETFAPAALDTLTAWIGRHTARPAPPARR